MRKILLASTAIATTFAVASANAEVSISGGASMHYSATSDNVTRTTTSDETLGLTDNTVTVSFSSVTDNGLSLSYSTEMHGGSSQSASISGDFGTITLSETAHAAEAFDVTSPTMVGGHGDLITAPTTSANGTISTGIRYNEADLSVLDGNNIAYYSPSINGFSFGVGIGGIDTTDDVTSGGVKYTADLGGASITVGYAASQGAANVSTNHLGAQVSMGDITVGIGNSTDEASTTDKEEVTSVGVTYAMNDQVTLNAGHVSSDNTLAAVEMNVTSVGVSYQIASGLTANIGHNEFEYITSGTTDNDGSIMNVVIAMSF
ncbi:porin [Alphaproteobacteria bacterium]|nr:porin [Alphaproteobacteria bacterium]